MSHGCGWLSLACDIFCLLLPCTSFILLTSSCPGRTPRRVFAVHVLCCSALLLSALRLLYVSLAFAGPSVALKPLLAPLPPLALPSPPLPSPPCLVSPESEPAPMICCSHQCRPCTNSAPMTLQVYPPHTPPPPPLDACLFSTAFCPGWCTTFHTTDLLVLPAPLPITFHSAAPYSGCCQNGPGHLI